MFKPEAILYVTDERQQLHFRQIFAIVRTLESRRPGPILSTSGSAPILGADGKHFTTRARETSSSWSDLLDEAEDRGPLRSFTETSPEMTNRFSRQTVARAVGIGAVKYADLSQNPQSLVTFTWDKALALDGNSAPYLQYACARIASVQDKYAERFPGKDPRAYPISVTDPLERKLASRLVRFPDVVIRAAEMYKPNVLADYLYDLAQVYSAFYQNVPFLKAEEGVRESRVRICDVTAKTLRCGLNLLGIETPARI